jgi:hypothetical protein
MYFYATFYSCCRRFSAHEASARTHPEFVMPIQKRYLSLKSQLHSHSIFHNQYFYCARISAQHDLLVWYTGLVSEFYSRKPNVACKICQKRVYRRPGVLEKQGGTAYCSSHCYGVSMRIETPCVVCGAPILAQANKKTCSRACANKNRAGILYTGRRLKDNVHSARILKNRLVQERGCACERCGFNICQVVQVHHRDRDRKNNSLSNLELLCPNCHASEHYLKN